MILADVKERGKKYAGRNELIAHLEGEHISRKGAMLAKCYECNEGYPDGETDCGIPSCPLYPYNPRGMDWKNRIKKPIPTGLRRNEEALL